MRYNKWLLYGERPQWTPISQHLLVDHVELEGNIGEEDIRDVEVKMGNLVDACYRVQHEPNVDGKVSQIGILKNMIFRM